jgi:LacI family transcriptional regulator
LGLARGRSHTVAILIPSLTWPWMGEVMQDVADVVESEGYALLLFTCNRGAESMRQFTTHLSADSFDGLLAIEPEGTLSYIAELHARGLPVVLIDDRGSRAAIPFGRHHQPGRRPSGRRPPAGARSPATAHHHRSAAVRLRPRPPLRIRRWLRRGRMATRAAARARRRLHLRKRQERVDGRSHTPIRNTSASWRTSKPPTIDIGTSSSSVTTDVQRRNLRLS